jgi:nucleoside recognition membrane protein YjiH
MRGRSLALAAVLGFIGVLSALTIGAMVQDGPDVLTVVSIVILAMFAFGVVGALNQPPDE